MRHNSLRHRRTIAWLVAATAATGGLTAVTARADASTTLTPDHSTITWSHGPFVAPSDSATVSVDVPADYWVTNPGGVTVRIDTGNPDAELDLFVTDVDGNDLAVSRYGARTYQQIYLQAPPNGAYVVTVRGTKDVPGPAYTGTASLVAWSPPQAPINSQAMQFARSTTDPQILGSEPGIAVDPRGPVYVDIPNGFNDTTSVIWRSDDGAQTFHQAGAAVAAGVNDPRQRPCAASSGGGDIDVAVDRTGRVYFADLEDFAISAGYSTDHGNTWHCNPLEGLQQGADRPWLATSPTADGSGPAVDAYIGYLDLISGQLPGSAQLDPQLIHVLSTSDGGKTWTSVGSFGSGLVPIPGPLFTNSTGTLYDVFSGNDAVWLAESNDHGQSFTVTKISQRLSDPRGNGEGWTVGAVDAMGNLYATWVDGGTGDVLYARSTDDGFSWSAPTRVNPPGQVGIRPWIAAGNANDIAISWYGAQGDFIPGRGAPDGTKWYAYVARNTDVGDPSTSFAESKLSPVPTMVGFGDNVDVGSIAADFFKVAIGPSGRVFAAFCDAGRVEVLSHYQVSSTVYSVALNAPPQPEPYVIVARQVSGMGLSSTAPAPPNAPAYAGPKSLRFTAAPTITQSGDSFSVSFRLAATNLADAISSAGVPATDAYWVVLLRTGARQEYVAMHQSEQGKASFVAGDHPTGGIYPTSDDECCASYPGLKTISGHIDAQGNVTITGPLSVLHLHAGQPVYNVQAFSMVGRPESVTRFNLLDEADATPATTQML